MSTLARDGRPTLRVLVVAESFLPQVNGVTNSVCRVLDHLAAEGHHAEVVAPTGPDHYAGFRVHHARSAPLPFYKEFRIGLVSRRWLRSVIDAFRPDVLHVASPAVLGHQAIRAAAETGVPSVAIHQTDLIGFAERYDVPGGVRAAAALTRRIHTLADRTLVPSRASHDQLAALGIPRLARWGRGVDMELFRPERRSPHLRARLAPDGELLVGYVGRLAPEKELGMLAHLRAVPGVRLVVVGGGPEESELRRLLPGAAFLGVLHGEELATAHASLDLFVHTGRHETYCQAAQEALASGVPVVAPRAGGPIDVVPHSAGLLHEPGDPEALVAAVTALVTDGPRRHRMAAAARPAVRDRSWEAVCRALVAHLRDVVESSAPTMRMAG